MQRITIDHLWMMELISRAWHSTRGQGMLPRILPEFSVHNTYQKYLNELKLTNFSGEIHIDYATRLSVANDNSIYQVIPEAVVFPRNTQDIISILQLASVEQFKREIQFCPRGGGTSTNGQSLTSGIVIDCSRYMRDILDLNIEEGWVIVQPGVVLDQLNDYLKPFGVSFAPEISTSNRATIGGMINTDAAGTGSRLVGRTSDHVLNLTCILSNGRKINSVDINNNDHDEFAIKALLRPHEHLINEKFPAMPRTLAGYNLKKALHHLNYLICGSEGTLAVVAECKLKLTPLPKFKKLLLVKYRSFDDALRAKGFDIFKPQAIEAIDEKLIDLARSDSIYFYLKDFIDGPHEGVHAVNIVEFIDNEKEKLELTVQSFCASLESYKNNLHGPIGFYIAQNETEIKLIWELRKKGVGLISKECDGTRRPIPFIEDTAVAPHKMADYISELKILLDGYGLHYGMYGHVDAGCMHVRPALDLKLQEDEHLLRELFQKVVALIEKYGGVLWGEHGQGHRTEFAERFFGSTLYQIVRTIKTKFDPYNQLNPGKIASAFETTQPLVKMDSPLRAMFDKQTQDLYRNNYSSAMICNGNGACFNYATTDVMCPSYKVTKDRVHSPKGRAVLTREWVRALSLKNFIPQKEPVFNFLKKTFNYFLKQKDFSHEVYQAMAGCLACKACAGQCPLSVDIPHTKAKFLELYHRRYLRPLRDYLIAWMEYIVPWQARFYRINNWFLRRSFVQWFFKAFFQLIDLPLVAKPVLLQELKKRNIPLLRSGNLLDISEEDKSRSLILLQDPFTSFYEPEIFLDICDLLSHLHFKVYVLPYFVNGKALEVRGFLKTFKKIAVKNDQVLAVYAQSGVPIVGIEPSMTLTYRDEYQKVLNQNSLNVLMIQEWLVTKCSQLTAKAINTTKDYFLLSHCSEKTMSVESQKQWQAIFGAFSLNLKTLPSGCCGMAGSYGHEREHLEHSKNLFAMDWKGYLEDNNDTILTTGYSCRSQAYRLMGIHLKHPLQVLKTLVL